MLGGLSASKKLRIRWITSGLLVSRAPRWNIAVKSHIHAGHSENPNIIGTVDAPRELLKCKYWLHLRVECPPESLNANSRSSIGNSLTIPERLDSTANINSSYLIWEQRSLS